MIDEGSKSQALMVIVLIIIGIFMLGKGEDTFGSQEIIS